MCFVPPPVPAGTTHADRINRYEGTKTCLACHEQSAYSISLNEGLPCSQKILYAEHEFFYPRQGCQPQARNQEVLTPEQVAQIPAFSQDGGFGPGAGSGLNVV